MTAPVDLPARQELTEKMVPGACPGHAARPAKACVVLQGLLDLQGRMERTV